MRADVDDRYAHHKYPNGSTLSKFDYAYDAVGNILTWRQRADTDAVLWEYRYDHADQLVDAVKKSTDPTPAILKRYAYRYDPAGNRTVEQIDDQVTGATHDNLNRLVSQQPSGAMVFAGTVSEAATVTVQGTPAVVTPDNQFRASVPVGTGTNAVTVTAEDPSGNVGTRQYEVDSFGTGRTFTYDANGNLTSDGTRTFEWNARNQLVAVNVGTHRTEFSYDGHQARVRTVEKENGVVQDETPVVWCDDGICEERAANGVTVIRRAYRLGEQVAAEARFVGLDHLGSVRVVTDAAGTLLGGYAFDPWGRRTLEGGANGINSGFTGHRWEATSQSLLTWHRGFDPDLGRWLSEDPLGYHDGPNFYLYVRNRPLSLIDPNGRAAASAGIGLLAAGWVYICQSRAKDQAQRHYKSEEDKKRHCFASCYFNRCMLLQAPGPTILGGIGWEILGGWRGQDSKDDIRADWYGVKSSFRIWNSCKTECDSCQIK